MTTTYACRAGSIRCVDTYRADASESAGTEEGDMNDDLNAGLRAAKIAGDIIDSWKGIYNLITPLRPRVAVGAETVADVQAAVRFAAEHGLGVAVRGGGHIVAKQDEGIVVINML
jgi:hypothetical protein